MTQQQRAAGVSAEDLVAAIRIHVDRVHDAVRRIGCEPVVAVKVVETSAVDLVETVGRRPETVADAVGWWFARARTLGRARATRNPADLPLGGGLLSVDDDQQVLAGALEELPEPERIALLLRDSYDLPAASVAAALDTDADGAMQLVGRARLAFLPYIDDVPAPPTAHHQSDPGALARVAETGPVAARDATTQRHVLSCPSCGKVADAQRRAHVLLTGLTVVALPEADRAGVLTRLEELAYRLLPTSAALLLRADEREREYEQYEEYDEDDEPRLFSPLLVLLAFVLAAVAGLGFGLLLTRDNDPSPIAASDQVGALASPTPSKPEVLISPPVVQAPEPVTSVFLKPSPSPSPRPPSPSPSPTATSQRLSLSVEPTSGGNGAELLVTGTGWPPDAQVTLDYLDIAGNQTGSRTTVTVDDNGEFSTDLAAEDPADQPGRHSVRATDGVRTVQAPYDVQP